MRHFEQLFDRILSRFVSVGFDRTGVFLGCTDDQLREIAEAQGVRLPESYVALMRRIGVRSGPIFDGARITYPDNLNLKDELMGTLNHYGVSGVDLKNSLVFMDHQAYQYWYMTELSNSDPAVWFYQEGFTEPVSNECTLSELVELFSRDRFDAYERNPSNLSIELRWFG